MFGDDYSKIKNKDNNHDTPKSPMGKSLFEKIKQEERKPKMFPSMVRDICV